jgi:hypothetical protein
MPGMSTKDSGLRIRVGKDLREAFKGACAAESRPASDVIREFMASYISRNLGGKQNNLFRPAAPKAKQPAKKSA